VGGVRAGGVGQISSPVTASEEDVAVAMALLDKAFGEVQRAM
jgi:hypothetical protein